MRRLFSRPKSPCTGDFNQAGVAAILVVGMIGLVFGLVMVAVSMETRNKLAESHLALQSDQLRMAGQSSVRLFEQYVRSGWVKVDCQTNALVPQRSAPLAVRQRFKNGAFIFGSCDPQFFQSPRASLTYNAQGRAPSLSQCGAVATALTIEDINASERYATVSAITSPHKKNFLIGNRAPPVVRARVPLPTLPVPSFGVLVNDLHCGMCHLKVNGDVVSTSPVTQFHEYKGMPWRAEVAGAWYAARDWNPSGGSSDIIIDVRDGVQSYYLGPKLPGLYTKRRNGTLQFRPQFPKISSAMLARSPRQDPFSCEKRRFIRRNAHTVLIGKKDAPIKLDGDIHIRGDLVITGWYQGVGTIYVDGNVYIPFDLRAVKSIFPYDSDPRRAEAAAEESVKRQLHDGLGIASRRSIILGEFDDNGDPDKSVWYNRITPPSQNGDLLGVKGVYSWYPGGKAAFDQLFGRGWNCANNTANGEVGSVNIVEAYLYAAKSVGGLSRQNSFSINGGVIADNFHVISRAQHCKSDIHPIHRQPMNWSYVNYDYRMRHGLPLLDRFAQYFQQPY